MIHVIVPIVVFMVLLAFPIAVHIHQEEAAANAQQPYQDEIAVSASVVEAGGKSIYRWGLKRGNNGSLPEVGKAEVSVLEAHGGFYVGDTTQKKIYLTFDEGYENGYTAQILDVLQAEGVKAIFFLTGDYFDKNPELVRRMVEEGHEVGNHTVHHYSLAEISATKIEQEILELDRLFYNKFQQHMRLLRPPKGEYNDMALSVADQLAHTCVLWSFAYQDWLVDQQKGTDYAFEMVTGNLHNGAILLLHAVSKDNANALTRIIQYAKEAGYTFGTADDLLQSRSVG